MSDSDLERYRHVLNVECRATGTGFDGGEVVVGTRHADGQQGDSLRGQRVGIAEQRIDVAVELHGRRTFDGLGIASNRCAVLSEHLRLVAVLFDVVEAVPRVAVLGDVAQRLLLAAAADQDRDVAGGCGIELGQARLDPR